MYTRGKGIVNTVKWDGIDGIDMLNSILFQSVALECIFLFLNLLAGVQVLHSYTSFNWTQNIALKPEQQNVGNTIKLLTKRTFWYVTWLCTCLLGNALMQRVWYLRLDSRLCWTYPIFLKSHTRTRLPAVPTISLSPATERVYTFQKRW